MSEIKLKVENEKTDEEAGGEKSAPGKKLAWETPKIEDVSEQVMAQPYIRFT